MPKLTKWAIRYRHMGHNYRTASLLITVFINLNGQECEKLYIKDSISIWTAIYLYSSWNVLAHFGFSVFIIVSVRPNSAYCFVFAS